MQTKRIYVCDASMQRLAGDKGAVARVYAEFFGGADKGRYCCQNEVRLMVPVKAPPDKAHQVPVKIRSTLSDDVAILVPTAHFTGNHALHSREKCKVPELTLKPPNYTA